MSAPWRFLKYTLAFTLPLTVYWAFTHTGWHSWVPLLYIFGLIPLLELFISARPENLSAAEAELVARDRIYDGLLYAVVPVQYATVLAFGWALAEVAPGSWTWWGRVVAMGLMCGVLGINVAHELGHRTKVWQQRLAQSLLITSLYGHFFVEHNYGHHRQVATPDDPATARFRESVFWFWWRSIWYSYRDAWRIQRRMLRRRSFWDLRHNIMLRVHLAQALLLGLVYGLFGLVVLGGFIGAALIGILLLETVNYIEHYGLQRQPVSAHRYEDTRPEHSWNSNHVVGRLLLFELSRHSDHHARPHKPYPLLDHHPQSPQMPTGYPGMMLLALVPPLWQRVVHPRLPRA
jgi:alkane 1-monooxygenase